MSMGNFTTTIDNLDLAIRKHRMANNELLKLVKGEWWLSPTKMTTDANGQFSFTGFLGEYELTLGRQKASFSLREKGRVLVSVSL
jgi:endo-1,4-beta-xylanase